MDHSFDCYPPRVMDPSEIEGLAGAIRGTSTSPEQIAKRHGLKLRIVDGHVLRRCGLAQLARVGTDWIISIRRGLSPGDKAWGIVHEVVEYRARNEVDPRIERLADSITAATLVPQSLVRQKYRCPADIFEIANLCDVTETCAAMRIGESVEPVLVLAPTHLHLRSPTPFVWPEEADLRRQIRCGAQLPGTVTVRFRVQRGRLAVLVENQEF